MDKDSRDKRFIRKPIYPGGNLAFKKFIEQNVKYPQEAHENKIEGIVIVRYDINYKGDVIKTRVLSGIGYGCNEEAERIVKLLKFEIPKGPRKVKIVFHRTTRIRFNLPKVPPQTYNYNYSGKEIEKSKEKSAPKKSYNYNVSW